MVTTKSERGLLHQKNGQLIDLKERHASKQHARNTKLGEVIELDNSESDSDLGSGSDGFCSDLSLDEVEKVEVKKGKSGKENGLSLCGGLVGGTRPHLG